MKQEVRRSGYGDYIALDFMDEDGRITATPFYITDGKSVEVHWGTPSSEQPVNPLTYDDFHDIFLFKMVNGELLVRWLNGPCAHMKVFTKVEPQELVEWRFQYAHKIINLTNFSPPGVS